MYESLWPLFIIVIIYFIFLGIFIAFREESLLNEKVLLSWMISLFAATIYFEIFIIALIALEIIAFFATFIIVYKIKEKRDYAIMYGFLGALILLALTGFYIDLYVMSYISVGIILFIVTILLNDYYEGRKPYNI